VKAKPVIPREQANRDVDEAVAYYLNVEDTRHRTCRHLT
jgi:hypothetical protein